jgi:hypothetical protein
MKNLFLLEVVRREQGRTGPLPRLGMVGIVCEPLGLGVVCEPLGPGWDLGWPDWRIVDEAWKGFGRAWKGWINPAPWGDRLQT